MKLHSFITLVSTLAPVAAGVALAGNNSSLASLALSVGTVLLPAAMGDMTPRRPLEVPLLLAPPASEKIPLAA